MADASEHDLTIEALAQLTGFTVPVVRDSVGYYGPEHVDRLRLVQELRAEGYGLKAVKRLLEQMGRSASSLLALRRALSQPLEAPPARIVDARELAAIFGDAGTPQTLQRAVEAGELLPLGDGRRRCSATGSPRPPRSSSGPRWTA